MYINIKGTDVFVRKSTGTSNLDDAAQIATNYYDKLKTSKKFWTLKFKKDLYRYERFQRVRN